MSTCFSMLLCAVVVTSIVTVPATAQIIPDVKFNGGRWCSGGSVSVFIDTAGAPGCPFGICAAWEIVVINAIDQWNATLASGAIPLTLNYLGPGSPTQCDACIVIEFANFSNQSLSTSVCGSLQSSNACSTCLGRFMGDTEFLPSGGDLPLRNFCGPTKVVINTGNINGPTGNTPLEVMMHELGHAIGLSHDAEPNHLMSAIHAPGAKDTLRYLDILTCIYSGLGGGSCERYSVNTNLAFAAPIVKFFFTKCDCVGCPSSLTSPPAGGAELTFVLAVNENGGPYEEFATITQNDLGDESDYTYLFTDSYENALFRLQVFENGVMIDETFTDYPVTIQGLPCPSDMNNDGLVNAADLANLLGAWSLPPGLPGCQGATPCAADITGDGVVNAADLAILLGAWGPCRD